MPERFMHHHFSRMRKARWRRLAAAGLLLALGGCAAGLRIGPDGRPDVSIGVRQDVPLGK